MKINLFNEKELLSQIDYNKIILEPCVGGGHMLDAIFDYLQDEADRDGQSVGYAT